MAPIESRFCRALPPAVDGITVALCGMAPTVSGIALHHAAFGLLKCRLNASAASIKARHLSLEGPRTFSSPSQDVALPDDCPFPVWRRPLLFLRPLQLWGGRRVIRTVETEIFLLSLHWKLSYPLHP